MNWNRLFAQRTARMRSSSIRELLKVASQPDMISFAGGLPDPELFPVAETREAAERVLGRAPASALQYSETEGIPALREWLAARFSRPHFRLERENVLITSGSQQALDLIGRVFLDPGDRVLVENPTYLAMLSAWRLPGGAFTAMPADKDGLRADALEAPTRAGVKLVYAVPDFQNPQGTTLSEERRRRLAALIRAADRPLVEDTPYRELRYDGSRLPSVFELDARTGPQGRLDARVLQLGTFSKVLVPGLRVGWVIAESPVIEKLALAKQAADLHTSTFCQYLALELVRAGVLERQLPRLRTAYRGKRDAMLQALADVFPAGVEWTRPAGGMFLMVTLPEDLDARALLPAALEHKVAFVPGEDFHLDGRGRNTMRLNFSRPSRDQIPEGVRRLGAVVADARAQNRGRLDPADDRAFHATCGLP